METIPASHDFSATPKNRFYPAQAAIDTGSGGVDNHDPKIAQ
jgi:hypothetical protein